jgi:hypothetical protein
MTAAAGHPRGARDRDKISVSVHFLRAVLRHTLHAGVDPLPLLRRQRIPPRLLRETQARISVQQFADLQTQTMLAMRDESLGYAERPIPLGTWEMMCHAVITSSTLGQALHRYCRFFQLFDERPCRSASEHDGDSGAIIWPERRGTHAGPTSPN